MTDAHQVGLQQAMNPATADPTRSPKLWVGDSNSLEPLGEADRDDVVGDYETSQRLTRSRL